MVKVKAALGFCDYCHYISFNHPMVKVKDERIPMFFEIGRSFNHPMVKVKAKKIKSLQSKKCVSTTLW